MYMVDRFGDGVQWNSSDRLYIAGQVPVRAAKHNMEHDRPGPRRRSSPVARRTFSVRVWRLQSEPGAARPNMSPDASVAGSDGWIVM